MKNSPPCRGLWFACVDCVYRGSIGEPSAHFPGDGRSISGRSAHVHVTVAVTSTRSRRQIGHLPARLFGDDGVDRTAPHGFGLSAQAPAPDASADCARRQEATRTAAAALMIASGLALSVQPLHPVVGMWKPADTASRAGHRVVIALVRV